MARGRGRKHAFPIDLMVFANVSRDVESHDEMFLEVGVTGKNDLMKVWFLMAMDQNCGLLYLLITN